MIKKISLFIPIFVLFFISEAAAHVKWFVDSSKIIEDYHSNVPFYYLTSREVLIWACISIIVVVLFSIVDRLVPSPRGIYRFAVRYERGIDRLAASVLGLYLISVSLIWNIILIPDIPVANMFTFGLLVAQLTFGVLFVLGIGIRTASVGLLGLCGVIMFKAGALELVENLITVSLAIYFYIRYSPRTSVVHRLDIHSVEIVRVCSGVALIVMAFSEKLAFPELGLSFLEVHQWNFMYNMGLDWYSDRLFVLSTGFAEMIFGIIFIFGYLTRINTILISSFFACSVVMMMAQFGQWEVEDLVVYSAAILFIFYGHGKTKFFHAMWPESVLHTRTIKNWFRKVM